MMQAYRTEGNYRSAARLSAAELRAAMASHEICRPPPWPLTPSGSCGSTWAASGP